MWQGIFLASIHGPLNIYVIVIIIIIIIIMLLLSLLPSFNVHSSFLGFNRIVDNDVKDLLEKFQNVKLSSINDKLDDIPTKEENERVMEKLFSFHKSMMDRFDRMESLLRKVGKMVSLKTTTSCNLQNSSEK